MAEEDQIKRGSNTGGSSFQVGSLKSGSSSKNPNKKKAPQRGPGVEELEKIILQQKNKGVAAVASPSILPSPSLQILNHPHSNQSSSSISFPSVSRDHTSSSNLVTRQPFPTQSVDFENSFRVPLMDQTSFAGFASPSPRITVLGQEDGTIMLNSYVHVRRENDGADPGLPFRSNVFLPYQSNLNFPPTISENSASASLWSPMLNFPMEPPSNQNIHYNYLITQRLTEERILGVKRPYPFSLDNQSGLSSNYQSLTSIPIRSDTLALHENRGSSRNLNFRDRPSQSTSTFAQNKNKSIENSLNGDFLSLATPSADPAFYHSTEYSLSGDFLSLATPSADPAFYHSTEYSLSGNFVSLATPSADPAFYHREHEDRRSQPTSTFAQNKNKSTENSLSGDFVSLATPSADPAFYHREREDFKSLPFENLISKSEQSSLPVISPADAASKNSEEIEEGLDLDLKL